MSQSLHSNIAKLSKKAKEPCEPVSYRDRQFESSSKYMLRHEEEQHLADGLAFLAQTQGGPQSVSAVTIEQGSKSQNLVVRLAANRTPSPLVVEGLGAVLEAVREGAGAGASAGPENLARFRFQLLDKVVRLSTPRLYSRIGSSQAKKKKWPPPKRAGGHVLYTRIEDLLKNINSHPPTPDNKLQLLTGKFELLVQALKAVDNGSTTDQPKLLKTVIQRSFDLSTIESSKTLSQHLQNLALPPAIHSHRTVIEIDKISRYLAVCNDLITLSTRLKCQPFFSNIRLERLPAPPACTPPGARISCLVHGEVQLVLWHEQHPSPLPPRCIGSSKSACFLCDLFISKHGVFAISHTHKRLYEKWTFPATLNWMSKKQKQKFEKIVKEMDVEILRCIATHKRRRPGYEGNGPESMVHVLELDSRDRSMVSVGGGSRLALSRGFNSASSSTITPARAKSKLSARENTVSRTSFRSGGKISPVVASQHDSGLGSTFSLTENHVVGSSVYSQDLPISKVSSQSSLAPHTMSSSTEYGIDDLPLIIKILPSTLSHVLVAGNAEYFFDFESVNAGLLEVSIGGGKKRMDVRALDTEKLVCIKAEVGNESLMFCLHDGDDHELRVTITWEDP